VNDDFKQPKQWASGTAIAQATEGSTAIVYSGPSTDELMKALAAVVFPGASGFNHLLLSARQLVTAPPVEPRLPLKRRDLLRQLSDALEREHAAVLKGDVGYRLCDRCGSIQRNLYSLVSAPKTNGEAQGATPRLRQDATEP